MLVTCLFVGWYTSAIVPSSGGAPVIAETFYPVGVHSYATGFFDGQPHHFDAWTDYSSADLPHDATLYGSLSIALVAGAVLALLLGVLTLVARGGSRRWPAPLVALFITGLAVMLPMLMVYLQPPTLCSEPSFAWPGPTPVGSNSTAAGSQCGWVLNAGNGEFTGLPSPPGPQSTFAGAQAGFFGSYTHTWGPGPGWYLSIGAGGLAGMGAIVLGRQVVGRPSDGVRPPPNNALAP
ncbi:MAG: hypothetical protein L3K09_00540 [Thermoplasmata archaeon]|nr:hypothetical protein [Thermoplasmata archaeon]